MGDIADILGLSASNKDAKAKPSNSHFKKKPQGMSREVFSLLDSDSLPPIVPTQPVPTFKEKTSNESVAKWEWTEFSNQARVDDLRLSHWQRQGSETNEYTFARFNRKTYVLDVSPSEYETVLPTLQTADPTWAQEDDNLLVELCAQFDLRWVVISDRWTRQPKRSATACKVRYYSLAKAVLALPNPAQPATLPAPGAAPVTNTVPQPDAASTPVEVDTNPAAAQPSKALEIVSPVPQSTAVLSAKAKGIARTELMQFNIDAAKELQRIQHLDKHFFKSREQEADEAELLNELRRVELQLRRLQKDRHANIARKAKPVSVTGTAHSIPRLTFMGSSGDHFKPKRVYLRSARLATLSTPNGLGKRMIDKLVRLLTELDVPQRPLPTAMVCNAYDKLRQDAVKLLSLQRYLHKKQVELSEAKGVPLAQIAPKLAPFEQARIKARQARAALEAPPEPVVDPATEGNPEVDQPATKTTGRKARRKKKNTDDTVAIDKFVEGGSQQPTPAPPAKQRGRPPLSAEAKQKRKVLAAAAAAANRVKKKRKTTAGTAPQGPDPS